MKVATASQMSEVDLFLIQHDNYTIEQLVDIASCKLLEELNQYHTYLLLVGPGNNGADALALAKHLIVLGKRVKIKLFYYEKANAVVRYFYDKVKDDIQIVDEDYKADVIVDGIFGNGLDRRLDEKIVNYLKIINYSKIKKVAIDIPTGINATTGLLQSICFRADVTITFMCLKLAMLNKDLKRYFGDIKIKSFDIEKEALEYAQVSTLIEHQEIIETLKIRKNNDHKGTNGKIVHYTGSAHYVGAAVLASLASVYSGSGLVKVCCEPKVLEAIHQHNLEAVVDEVIHIKESLQGQDAILCGCGSGWNDKTYHTLKFLLENSSVPIVIDADGINSISEHLELLKQKHCSVIMTPHLGEFARLCPNYQNLEKAVKTFADEYQVILVVKGPNTMVYGEHQFYRNTTGNPGMATAGMGDTLAGIITSFCGQGYLPLVAAKLGVYLHGMCGDRIYSNHYTVLPHALIKEIPIIMKELSNEKDINRND